MFRTKPPRAAAASPAPTFKHANIIGLGAAFLTGAVLYFNGTYGYQQGAWGLAAAFVGFAIVKDGALSYAWSARGEYGRLAAGILSLIALSISCLAAIGAASSGKQQASDPKARQIERYNAAQRQRNAAAARLAELGSVPSAADAQARADAALAAIDAAIVRRTANCSNLAPKSAGRRQIAVNRESCAPYSKAKALIADAKEAAELRAKRDQADQVLAEGKPASSDAQASTIAWLLSLFTKLHGIDSIQAFTNLMIGLGLEISSPLAWAAFASAKRGHVLPAPSSKKVEKIDIAPSTAEEKRDTHNQAHIPGDVSGQSDFPAVADTQFAELKAAFIGEQPNGPSAEIVVFPVPNGSPNGSGPKGPKPSKRARFAKDQALEDLVGRLDSGERFGSQDELASRYGVAKSTMSDWLGEWERSGAIPQRMTVGRCKEVAAG